MVMYAESNNPQQKRKSDNVPKVGKFSSQELSSATKLTSQELDHLCSVMLRAKKFDEEETKIIEGQLSKYTNVVKGWQYRWFVINPSIGILEYFSLEDRRKPRGCISLAGCQIVPSDEDSQTFTVIAACGEVYKLKAFDAKDRQIWVDNLRLATQLQENKAKQNPPLAKPTNRNSKNHQQVVMANSPLSSDLLHSFDSVQYQLSVARESYDQIVNLIEDTTNTDEDLLLVKATSLAAINSLEQCFSILESLTQSNR